MSQQPLNGDKQRVKITFAGASAATVLRPITPKLTRLRSTCHPQPLFDSGFVETKYAKATNNYTLT